MPKNCSTLDHASTKTARGNSRGPWFSHGTRLDYGWMVVGRPSVWKISSSELMMIRGVTMIMMCRVSRPMPTFLNSRFRYGILLRTGGPNSLRPFRQRLQPAQQHRAAVRADHGRVWTFRVVNAGCWRNCVNGIGWPWLPPSNTGVMNVVTGNSGTDVPGLGRQRDRQVQPDEPPVGRHDRLDRDAGSSCPRAGERAVVRDEHDLPVHRQHLHVGHEELRVLNGEGRGLAVEQRQLRGLHDVHAAVALGGLHEHVDLDVVQERQTRATGRRCCPGVFG